MPLKATWRVIDQFPRVVNALLWGVLGPSAGIPPGSLPELQERVEPVV